METTYQESRKVRKAFEAMILEFRPSLWSYCLNLTGSPWDAEDLAQETVLKAFAKLSFMYQSVQPKAYLFRIATNSWIDQCRRNKAISFTLEEEIDKYIGMEEVDPIDIRHSLEVMCDVLPPRQRVVFLLSDVFEFRIKEIVEMTSITDGAVKSLLYRARKSLLNMRHYEKQGIDRQVKKNKDHVIDTYIEAFNKRDADRIADLLTDQSVMEIVGVTEELGKEMIRTNSLSEWEKDSRFMKGEWTVVFGQVVLCVFVRDKEQDNRH